MNLNKIKSKIHKIGCELVRCNTSCKGVKHNQRQGILPRSLWLNDREKNSGLVIIGINPGRAKKKERKCYRNHIQNKGNKSLYNLTVRWLKGYFEWSKPRREHKSSYFTKLKILIEKIGFNGPILFTDLVKCQNKYKKKRFPPIETIRTCISKYLNKELDITSLWPIITLGKDVFNIIACRYLDRTIIGIPHISGAYGISMKHNAKFKEIEILLNKSRKGKITAKWYKKL